MSDSDRDTPPATGKEPLRVAVIGVGGFGRHHARIYGELSAREPSAREPSALPSPQVRLVGLVDLDRTRAEEHARKWNVPVAARVEDLPSPVDAVTVAVPTSAHAAVAVPLLRRGVHCLVEKPIAPSTVEARRLLDAAREGGAVLAVGHVERFNPVMDAVERLGIQPVFLEVHRLAPFSFRSADVGVVMDLMIHDLDIVLHLVGEDPSAVDAVGVPVIGSIDGGKEDIANVRLTFPSGAVANETASRVSLNRMRKIRIFGPDAYVSLDYDKRQALLVRKSPRLDRAALEAAAGRGADLKALANVDFGDLLHTDMLPIDDVEPLREEILGFVAAIRGGPRPRVGGEEGLRALAVAERILRSIAERPRPKVVRTTAAATG